MPLLKDFAPPSQSQNARRLPHCKAWPTARFARWPTAKSGRPQGQFLFIQAEPSTAPAPRLQCAQPSAAFLSRSACEHPKRPHFPPDKIPTPPLLQSAPRRPIFSPSLPSVASKLGRPERPTIPQPGASASAAPGNRPPQSFSFRFGALKVRQTGTLIPLMIFPHITAMLAPPLVVRNCPRCFPLPIPNKKHDETDYRNNSANHPCAIKNCTGYHAGARNHNPGI